MNFTDLLDRYLDAKQAVIDAEGCFNALRLHKAILEDAKADLDEYMESGGLRP